MVCGIDSQRSVTEASRQLHRGCGTICWSTAEHIQFSVGPFQASAEDVFVCLFLFKLRSL